MRTLAAVLMVLGCIAIGGPATARAATIVVTSQNDFDDGTCDLQHCSLREAILEANSTDGADDLVLASSEPITPATPLPLITE
jgi:CSLREA domain-containing protein